jgi:Phage tail protein RIFT-related domain
VLTEVKAYSSWKSAPTLPLSDTGRAETDLIQVRNINGLDPVKAAINTSPFGSVDGVAYTGSSVLSRNIVLTLHPNPNWDSWSYEGLRRLLYSYFMPKRPTRLVFYSDDMGPVEISGIVESVEVNPFSNDPELIVSIVCPDPYFISLTPTVLTGQSIREGGVPTEIDYEGTVDIGVYVKVTHVSDPTPTLIWIQIGDPEISYFKVDAAVNSSMYFEMSSIPTQKYVQNINMSTGVIINLLSKVHVIEGSSWPTILEPGINEFSVITNQGVQDWELTYYERFGGL